MKPIILILFLLIFNSSFAQRLPGGVSPDGEYQTEKKRNNFYAGFVAKGANFLNDWGLEIGGKVGANLNNSVVLGIGFYSLLTRNLKVWDSFRSRNNILVLGYGTIETEFSHKISDNLRISFNFAPGLGRADYQNFSAYGIDNTSSGDWFFFVEPGLVLNWKVSDIFWLGIGYHYRSTFGVNLTGLKNSDISGSILSLSISTGNF
ncbi:MAG: hypothetical protein N2319_01200 [Candidatus Kapabacteria bacterium]|nr:hypothetical protein [Candidatus Kapabacteria bacterium]